MNENLIGNDNNIIFYETKKLILKLKFFLDDNVWLNVYTIANLFKVDRTVIKKHINNIYNDEQLNKNSTCAKITQVRKDANKKLEFYNLNAIIVVGYMVNSKKILDLDMSY